MQDDTGIELAAVDDDRLMTAAAARTFRSPRVIAAGLLASCAPLVLLAFNRDWIFTSESNLDAWHYVGFFHEYLNPHYSPGAYKLARLPWILAGFVANRLLPPIPAAIVLHAVFLCVASGAIFVGVYALFRRVALAAVIAVALGFYTHAHGSGGWDYHNTAAGAFYLLAFMLLALPAATLGRPVVLTLAGAAAALAVHSNITYVNLLPALALVYAVTVRTRHPERSIARTLGRAGAWGLLGAVLVTAVLGLINWMAGREFLFFSVLVNIAARYVADPSNQAAWYRGWSREWLLRSHHLVLPAAVLVAAIAGVILGGRSTSQPADRLARALVLQFVIASAIWIGWQTEGQTALDWDYFAFPLIQSCFIALAALLSWKWTEVFERHWAVVTLGTIVLCTFCLVGPEQGFKPIYRATRLDVIPEFAFLAASLLLYRLWPGASTTVLFIASFAVANRIDGAGTMNYQRDDPCQIQAQVYAAIVDGAGFLGRLDPTYTQIRTWFDEKERLEPVRGCPISLADVSGSTTAVAALQYVAGPWPMPAADKVPETTVLSMANGAGILAIMSNRADPLETWRPPLKRMGLTMREIARHQVPVLSSGFTILAVEIVPRAPEGLTFGKPALAVTPSTPAQPLLYGTRQGHLEMSADIVRFVPGDTRDHVTYGFTDISPLAEPTWARLTVEMPAAVSNPSSCKLLVQDKAFNALAAARCASLTRDIILPANTSALRVVLLDEQRHAFVLPRKVDLALSSSLP